MSLYSKQLSLLVLWQNFKVLVAILTASQTLCLTVSFPNCDCKVIANFDAVQIF